ncbi:turripeptide OL11-like [Trichogramma pretiosum]|uniref:turripeptide OL11-like n=1 Tax=Trichogramma pretiosum TaxID=7493 RepID=UPI000C71B690|nr:turripeptide OL11-like [Trichogramma pretiosum]
MQKFIAITLILCMLSIVAHHVSAQSCCPWRQSIYTPVCGSDGKTYNSALAVTCYNRCNNKSIQVVHSGKC